MLQKYFYNYFLFYILIFSIISGFFSYKRFIVDRDYFISYEIPCNQQLNICFKGEKDDNHTEDYYYAIINKYTPNVYTECGDNVIGCDVAVKCLPSDNGCFVRYCDPLKNKDDCGKEIVNKDNSTNL